MKRPEGMSREDYKQLLKEEKKRTKEKMKPKIKKGTYQSANTASRRERRKMRRDIEKAGGFDKYLTKMLGRKDVKVFDEEE